MAGISKITPANYLTLKVDDTVLNHVNQVSGGGVNANVIDVLEYNTQYAQKLVGSRSVDAFEVVCGYVPESADYKAMQALIASAETVECVLTIKSGPAVGAESNTITFQGIVTSKSISTEFDAQATVTYTIAVSGGLVEAAGV